MSAAPQSDPNVFIPPQARAQIKAGREIEKLMTGKEPPPLPEVGRDDAELQVDKREPFIEPKRGTAPPPKEANEPAVRLLEEDPEPELVLETVPKQAFDKLVAQHQTLQGKYAVEGRELRAELAAMRSRIEELSKPAAVPLTVEKGRSKITDEELREYGPDLIDIIARKAQEIADETIAAQVGPLVSRVDLAAKAAEEVKGDRFRSYMDANVKDWRTIDREDGFFGWLSQEDPFSGIKRGDILKNAIEGGDYPRCKMIFEGYASETAAIAQPRRTETVKPAGSVKLDTLAAPASTRGRTEAIVDNSAPEAMTGEEIAAYFRRKTDPRSKMAKAEIDAMEARISRAVKAGMVQSRSHL